MSTKTSHRRAVTVRRSRIAHTLRTADPKSVDLLAARPGVTR